MLYRVNAIRASRHALAAATVPACSACCNHRLLGGGRQSKQDPGRADGDGRFATRFCTAPPWPAAAPAATIPGTGAARGRRVCPCTCRSSALAHEAARRRAGSSARAQCCAAAGSALRATASSRLQFAVHNATRAFVRAAEAAVWFPSCLCANSGGFVRKELARCSRYKLRESHACGVSAGIGRCDWRQPSPKEPWAGGYE